VKKGSSLPVFSVGRAVASVLPAAMLAADTTARAVAAFLRTKHTKIHGHETHEKERIGS
jgi:hypothetical protein